MRWRWWEPQPRESLEKMARSTNRWALAGTIWSVAFIVFGLVFFSFSLSTVAYFVVMGFLLGLNGWTLAQGRARLAKARELDHQYEEIRLAFIHSLMRANLPYDVAVQVERLISEGRGGDAAALTLEHLPREEPDG